MAALVGKRLPVDIKRVRVVLEEDAGLQPFGEGCGGASVTVVVRGIAGALFAVLEAHDVEGAAVVEGELLLG